MEVRLINFNRYCCRQTLGRCLAILLLAVAAQSATAQDAEAESDLELMNQLEQAVLAARNTAAMESTLHINEFPKWVLMMRRELEATPAQLQNLRQYFRDRLELARKGPSWPEPPSLQIPFAVAAPVIDGQLDDDVWKHAAMFDKSYLLNEAEPAAKPATAWKMLWDQDHLYFAFRCEDDDVSAPHLPRDDAIYSADCVEMFILPRLETGIYWELIVSPSGSVYDGLHAKWPKRWGSATRPEFDIAGLRFAVQINGTLNDHSDHDGGYNVEVAVPFAALPEYALMKPQAGQTINIMLVRLEKSADDPLKVFSFIPLLSWGHNIWNHARGRLVGP